MHFDITQHLQSECTRTRIRQRNSNDGNRLIMSGAGSVPASDIADVCSMIVNGQRSFPAAVTSFGATQDYTFDVRAGVLAVMLIRNLSPIDAGAIVCIWAACTGMQLEMLLAS